MNAAQAASSGAAFPENPAPEPTARAETIPGAAPAPGASRGWDYFNQVLPAPPVVCGKALKPLSIGRYRRMRRQNIAFVSDETIEVPAHTLVGDLLKGVLICSLSCEDYDAFIQQADADKQILKWAQHEGFLRERYHDWPIVGQWFAKYIVTPEVAQMRDERAALYLLEQIEIFQEYIAAAQRIPNYSRKENSPARHTLHWSNSIELHLRSEQNWTEQEINEAPLSKALTDYFGYAESHGLIRINTDAEIEQAEANAKIVAGLLAMLAQTAAPESAPAPKPNPPDAN